MNVDLERVQEELFGKLNAEAYYDDVNVVLMRKLVVEQEVEKGLLYLTEKGGKVGVGIMVGMPSIEVPEANEPGPNMRIVMPFLTQEQPTLNTSGKTAEGIAIFTMQLLHQFGIHGLGSFYATRRAIVPNTDDEGAVSYEVLLEARVPLQPETQVTMPAIEEVTALQVGLSNLTDGATIYYTTDGSFPGKGNEEAEVYVNPFNVEPGTVVRWAAYKTGMRGSDVGEATIS